MFPDPRGKVFSLRGWAPLPGRASDVEPDPLRQGQVGGIIDRIRLPAHIGFPGIAAALPASTGLFFTSEGSADLGSRSADIDIRYAAVAAGGRKEPLRFPEVEGHDG